MSTIINHSNNQHILLFHSASSNKRTHLNLRSDAFIDINQRITDTLSSGIQSSASSRVVCISSGAASNVEMAQNSPAATVSDPYGQLKLSEEIRLSDISESSLSYML